MSTPELQEVARLERAPVIDDGAQLRIRQVRPVEKAASPIIDHNLELIDLAVGLKKWYQGKGVSTPHDLLGDLLDPNENNACSTLTAFIDTVKRFKPGAFPAHCDAVRELEFTTVRLIRTLMEISDSPVFVEALKRVGALFATLADPINFTLSDHDFQQRLNSRLANLIESFAEISGLFKKRERERDFEIVFRKLPPEPATKEDVKEIVSTAAGSAAADLSQLQSMAESCASETKTLNRKADALLATSGETLSTVRRVDRRGKRDNRRRRFTVEQQEQCFRYWDLGKKHEKIKENTPGKVRYEHVFAYYRKELSALGIKDEKDFKSALGARSDRISRSK